MKIKRDFAKPIWDRTPTKLDKFFKSWFMFAIVILLMVLGGAKYS